MSTSYLGRNTQIASSRPIKLRHFSRWIFPRSNAASWNKLRRAVRRRSAIC